MAERDREEERQEEQHEEEQHQEEQRREVERRRLDKLRGRREEQEGVDRPPGPAGHDGPYV